MVGGPVVDPNHYHNFRCSASKVLHLTITWGLSSAGKEDSEGELSRPILTARIPRLGHFAPHGVPASSRIGAGLPGTRTTLLGHKDSSPWR